jgi:hypothetical protein
LDEIAVLKYCFSIFSAKIPELIAMQSIIHDEKWEMRCTWWENWWCGNEIRQRSKQSSFNQKHKVAGLVGQLWKRIMTVRFRMVVMCAVPSCDLLARTIFN